MIYTSRYSNPELNSGAYVPVAISVGKPRWPLKYKLAGEIMILAPTRAMIKMTDKEAYRNMYIERLNSYGVDRILKALRAFEREGKDTVLLCFEDIRKPENWCHRTMFAEWWNEQTGEVIEELTDPSGKKKKEEKVKTKPVQTTNEKQLSLIEFGRYL